MANLTTRAISSSAEHPSARGGADAGGGNSVDGELFDDFENKDSQLLSASQVEAYVEPILDSIANKIPGFAETLRRELRGDKSNFPTVTPKKWYLEPKALAQTGSCLNKTSLSVKRVVRACQTSVAIRIDKDFFLSFPAIQGPLILHELLVFQQLEHQEITDEAVRELNRVLRSPQSSPLLIQQTLTNLGFGTYRTSEQRKLRHALAEKAFLAHCEDRKEEAARLANEFESADGEESFNDQVESSFEVLHRECPKATGRPKTAHQIECARSEKQAAIIAATGQDKQELHALSTKLLDCYSYYSVDHKPLIALITKLDCRMFQLAGSKLTGKLLQECERLGYRF